MTNKERRFVEYWADQRKGSKTEYYVTYIFGWTIVLFLCAFFGLKIVLDEYKVGNMMTLYIIAPASLIVAVILTHFTYTKNEKKYHQITKSEVR